jgi:hypothetical protein
MRRVTRRVLLTLFLVVAAATGIWFYENGSITRLRKEYIPWMERLARWRDACEASRRALRSRSATPADPDGIAALREWAWRDLDRLGFVDFRVTKPRHENAAGREKTEGRVRFTVGGFRADGSRVEREADVRITEETVPPAAPRFTVQLERALSDRREERPRFHNATAESGLGASRHDPPLKKTNWLIADIWPGSGVAVLDYDGDGAEDLFVADGVRSILYRNDGRGRFTDVHRAGGPGGILPKRESPRPESPRATWTATATRTSS